MEEARRKTPICCLENDWTCGGLQGPGNIPRLQFPVREGAHVVRQRVLSAGVLDFNRYDALEVGSDLVILQEIQ